MIKMVDPNCNQCRKYKVAVISFLFAPFVVETMKIDIFFPQLCSNKIYWKTSLKFGLPKYASTAKLATNNSIFCSLIKSLKIYKEFFHYKLIKTKGHVQ